MIDANTSEKLIDWKLELPSTLRSPVAVHPTTGLIYTTDGINVLCLDPKLMQ